MRARFGHTVPKSALKLVAGICVSSRFRALRRCEKAPRRHGRYIYVYLISLMEYITLSMPMKHPEKPPRIPYTYYLFRTSQEKPIGR